MTTPSPTSATNLQRVADGVRPFVPAEAVDYVAADLVAQRVQLRIDAPRRSKLGHYISPSPQRPYHLISINDNLPPYLFLLVMLHELAHLHTYLSYGHRVTAHGHEWQQAYATLLRTYGERGCFPPEAMPLLQRYVAAIPLNRRAGKDLEELLGRTGAHYDPAADIRLRDLPVGSLFALAARPQLRFRSIEKRRTRYVCERLDTGTRYLVAERAPVVALQ